MVNYLSVLVTAIVMNLFAMLLYGKVFFKIWMKLSNVKNEKPVPWKMAVGFVSLLVWAYVLAWLIEVTSVNAYGLAFMVWIGFIATNNLNPVLWKNSPFKLYILDNAHNLIGFFIAAGILSWWI